MENRRQYYRHAIPPARGMTVRLRTSDLSFLGELIDLSIGGLCVKCQTNSAPPGKTWTATFALGSEGAILTIPVEQVYARDEPPGHCGFRFLPRPNPRVLEEQERVIWSFLLDEQRGQRRQARQARRPGA